MWQSAKDILRRPLVYWSLIGVVAAFFTKQGPFDWSVWTFWMLICSAVGCFVEWRQTKNRKFAVLSVVGIVLAACLFTLAINFRLAPVDRLFCRKSFDTLDCYKNHPFAFQLLGEFENPVLDESMKEVATDACKDITTTADTLSVGFILTPNNAHYSEEMAELVDSLLVKEPECLLKAILKMRNDSREKLLSEITYMDGQEYKSGGPKALMRFLDEPAYRELLARFRSKYGR